MKWSVTSNFLWRTLNIRVWGPGGLADCHRAIQLCTGREDPSHVILFNQWQHGAHNQHRNHFSWNFTCFWRAKKECLFGVISDYILSDNNKRWEQFRGSFPSQPAGNLHRDVRQVTSWFSFHKVSKSWARPSLLPSRSCSAHSVLCLSWYIPPCRMRSIVRPGRDGDDCREWCGGMSDRFPQ